MHTYPAFLNMCSFWLVQNSCSTKLNQYRWGACDLQKGMRLKLPELKLHDLGKLKWHGSSVSLISLKTVLFCENSGGVGGWCDLGWEDANKMS